MGCQGNFRQDLRAGVSHNGVALSVDCVQELALNTGESG